MRTSHKRIWITLWIILGGMGNICNLIVDLPHAVEAVLQHGPAWASDPRVTGAVVITGLMALGIYFTWRKPIDDDPFSECAKALSRVSIRCSRLESLLGETRDFYHLILGHDPRR